MKHILKHLTAVMLIAAMMATMFTCGASAAERLLGDVDGDGEVTVNDATYIQRALVDMSIPFELDEKLADTDEDGSLTILDVTNVQRWISGLPSNQNIGQPIAKETYNTYIEEGSLQTVLKYSDKGDSKLFSMANTAVYGVLMDINPDAAYYFTSADTTVVGLAAKRTVIYAVREGSTTADVYQELDDETTKIGTINVSVVTAKMSEVAEEAFMSYTGSELVSQQLKPNFGKTEYEIASAIKKVLINNEELGTKFTEDDFTVTYKSSNEKIAVVSDSGVVSGTGNGECQIIYTIHFSDDSE